MEEREATRRLSTTTVASSELSGLYEILTQWNGEVADPEMAASWAPRAAPLAAAAFRIFAASQRDGAYKSLELYLARKINVL